MTAASLLVPTLAWDPAHGFGYLDGAIADALEVGVGGFHIRGGPREQVRALTDALRAASQRPLLLGADAEAGAGEHFTGCTQLPPPAALGALGTKDEPGIARRAARITAQELRAMGLNWALGPVCDLDLAPGTSAVSVRAAGSHPARVATFIAEWVDACQAEGVLSCAKHFPGLGRSRGDPYRGPVTIAERPQELWQADLAPFRSAIDAGVASVMVSHATFPTLDRAAVPASLSAPILQQLLRDTMQFDGLVTTDALAAPSVLAHGPERELAIRAIAAGCDVLLGVTDVHGTSEAVTQAVERGRLSAERVREASERCTRWAQWGASPRERETSLEDAMWARQSADRAVQMVRGEAPRIGQAVELVIVDEDANGPWPARERGIFEATLRTLDVDAPVVEEPTAHTRVPVLVMLFCEVIPWKGFDAPSEQARERVTRIRAMAARQQRECTVVLFGHPRHAAALGDVVNVACAWNGDAVMQAGAARALARRTVRPASG